MSKDYLSSAAADTSKERRFSFLGLDFHSLTRRSAIQRLEDFIAAGNPRMVATITAELAVRAGQDPRLKDIYNQADLLTIDSFVIYYAARLMRKPVLEPVNAARLMLDFLPIAQAKGYRIYLLGAVENVVKKTAQVIENRYPGIKIVGFHNGYFDFDNDRDIVYDIKSKNPDILFVAMTSPLKENFISKNLKSMGVPVSIGVGGCFDTIAGKSRLAPLWVSRAGLEWFYRFLQEPRRMWKRYTITNIKFLFLLLKEVVRKI